MTQNGQNRNCSILIVDDDSLNLQIIANMLKEEGYQTDLAKDGKTALKKIRENKFDLILLDIIMAEMDGYEVCRILKKSPETMDIPVIFISALNSTEDKINAFKVGGVDYITKPFI